jgi:hypothetical protein
MIDDFRKLLRESMLLRGRMEQSTKAAVIELERRVVAHAKSPADISKTLKGQKWKERSLPRPKKPR